MSTEAQIFQAINGDRNTTLVNWPGAKIARVPGTSFERVRFADSSELYLSDRGVPVNTQEILKSFWATVCTDPQVIKWALSAREAEWPEALVKAFGLAVAKDPFCGELWAAYAKK